MKAPMKNEINWMIRIIDKTIDSFLLDRFSRIVPDIISLFVMSTTLHIIVKSVAFLGQMFTINVWLDVLMASKLLFVYLWRVRLSDRLHSIVAVCLTLKQTIAALNVKRLDS